MFANPLKPSSKVIMLKLYSFASEIKTQSVKLKPLCNNFLNVIHALLKISLFVKMISNTLGKPSSSPNKNFPALRAISGLFVLFSRYVTVSSI